MDDSTTTVAVQAYLDDLAKALGQSQAEPIVRDLLARAVSRLHLLCAHMLYQRYPRLSKGPLNLCPEELLSAVVERLMKAMREVRPRNVRQFFAIANQHMRWELNGLARRLDEQAAAHELRDSLVMAPGELFCDSVPPVPSSTLASILSAIDGLPEEEREAFNLVRLQGMGVTEAARVVGVSAKTIQRRLKRSLILLTDRVGDPGSDQNRQLS